MDNLRIYNAAKAVPEKAKKPISAGRLKGMTDINPMWRIKALTEIFGPCGEGWYVQIADKRIEAGAEGVMVAIVDVNLFYKTESGEWSAPVFGTGGSCFVATERNGLYTSDEAFKMAYTDALSVCCKMLGFGADVYWSNDRDKYTTATEAKILCADCGKEVTGYGKYTALQIANAAKKRYGVCLCADCGAKRKAAQEAQDERPPWEEG